MEYFLNEFNNEYDSAMVLGDKEGVIPIFYHYHGNDPLTTPQVLQRWQNKGGGSIPTGFICGVKMWNMLDTAEISSLGRRTENYSNDIYIDGYYKTQDDFSVQIGWDVDISGEGSKVFFIITEDMCYGNGGNIHRHVFRRMLGVNGIEFSNRISITTIYNNEWNVDKTFLTVLVEDAFGQITGAKQMPMRESITTGVLTIPNPDKMYFKVYPNPATDVIHLSGITGTLLINNISIYNVFGIKVLESNNSNTVDVSSLSNGMYMVVVNDVKRIQFLKQ